MKTYLQLIFEVRTIRSKEDAEKMRLEKENPDDYAVRNKGGGHHHPVLKDRLKQQRTRRSSVMKSISYQDLVNFGNRNLIPDSKKIAKKALGIERKRKRDQRADAQRQSQESGEQYDVDHIMSQMDKKKNTGRYHKIHPGDASDNRRVISQRENLRKGSKDLGDKKMTRARVISQAFQRGYEALEQKKKGQIQK
jgi:hypothetical protein